MRLAICLLTLLLLTSSVGATSLWGMSNQVSLYTDHRARYVGDLVTILIVERSSATQAASTSTGRSSGGGIGPNTGLLDFIPFFRFEGKSDTQAQGQTDRSGELEAQVTAQVVEVLPTGNLRIEGKRAVEVNGEKMEVVITGIIRPRDVTSKNTVLSTYVAEAEIQVKGMGPIAEAQRQGLITDIINFFF